MAAAAPLWPPTPTLGAGTADERRPLNPADGAATGDLRRAEGGPPRRARGLVADACLALPLWLVLWLPAYREDAHGVVAPDAANRRDGYEALLTHAFAPCFAAFLYLTASARAPADAPPGLAERALRHAALVALGDAAFVVYLFQAPVYRTFELAYGTGRFQALVAVEPLGPQPRREEQTDQAELSAVPADTTGTGHCRGCGLRVEYLQGLYHELRSSPPEADLVACFQPGIWGYASWQPTIRTVLRGGAPCVIMRTSQ